MLEQIKKICPKFFSPPKEDTPRPFHIRNLIKSLEKSYYNSDKGLIHLILKNKTFRQLNKSRLHAIIVVCQVLVYFTDFRTGYVVKKCKATNDFEHLSISQIAKYANISVRTVKRALNDLGITLYFQSKRRVEKISELIYKSYSSMKKLTDKFFLHLGMKPETLKKIRRFKEQEHNNKKSYNEFHIDEVKFIRSNVIQNAKKNNKNFTEKIPINILQIIKNRFST